jgi:hypothetical protein
MYDAANLRRKWGQGKACCDDSSDGNLELEPSDAARWPLQTEARHRRAQRALGHAEDRRGALPLGAQLAVARHHDQSPLCMRPHPQRSAGPARALLHRLGVAPVFDRRHGEAPGSSISLPVVQADPRPKPRPTNPPPLRLNIGGTRPTTNDFDRSNQAKFPPGRGNFNQSKSNRKRTSGRRGSSRFFGLVDRCASGMWSPGAS